MCSMARAFLYWADAALPAASNVSPVASEIRCRWKKLCGLFTPWSAGCDELWTGTARSPEGFGRTVSDRTLSTIHRVEHSRSALLRTAGKPAGEAGRRFLTRRSGVGQTPRLQAV